MSEATAAAGTGNKSKLILFILIGLLFTGAGIGGTWYFMKKQHEEAGSEAVVEKKKPAAFVKIESFTVNLQPEERESHYLQVELSLKVNETAVITVIENSKPEIRNQILLLLSSKKPSEINTLDGKQKLSQDIIQAIRSKIGSEALQNDILDVLFTSFIIQ
ncbi:MULTISPECIES: flagellar basal body-associated protein FliL [Nitrosomonas]|uniref:Flagellar protein FliL n=2 Tax=Nitrosomonas eutropha TaxID=916 RepID=A0ABX5M841_9PROT|nr:MULTISPECIES: flagellar basal body-associated protein FliL [Nitrosomonas]ABI60278.1 flagellar basal body-associated protein FliL [Nitrosomonas eutropha C91]MXS80627.1 flagellar basal body-associated protein FliL [Nitrosomonas sp. GH22]PXV81681.1 flagellar FliL protein [Nitrosomonas eutropha]SCX11967.1 flagellar FliL protein [Nitrosomonas eutropha]SDW73890.1 flagellar FliL protein [Nitrosomonas eutropha]